MEALEEVLGWRVFFGCGKAGGGLASKGFDRGSGTGAGLAGRVLGGVKWPAEVFRVGVLEGVARPAELFRVGVLVAVAGLAEVMRVGVLQGIERTTGLLQVRFW